MKTKETLLIISGWIFASLLIITGILNMVLVHPVPGIVYFLLSMVYLPPANSFMRDRFGFTIPLFIKAPLAVIIILFTLGVSDLGEMYF